MLLTAVVLLMSSLLGLAATYMAVTEKDLLKAIGFSALQSVAFCVILQALAAPDIVLAYVAISVGLYSALLVIVVSKTERYEA
ncbi:MAG: hydrogenase subunit MbhD domain-containing protein [Desulfurococcaceae archaeon]